MTKVKICGITNLPDAISAVLLGADYVGFLVEIKSSKDNVTIEEAKEIISKLPLEVKPVYVTYEKKAKKIIEIAKEIDPALIQLHNDIDIREIKQIRRSLKQIQLTKTVSVKNKKSIKEAKKFSDYVNFILLDTAAKGKKGGTGRKHDWDISAEIVKEIKKPVFLAGGLNPDNVLDAVKKVQPFAVDVNSGVKARDRKKDHHKMKLFIEKVRKNEAKRKIR